MHPQNRHQIESRVVEAAEAALAQRKYVTAIDILVGIGWLHPSHVDRWRQDGGDVLRARTIILADEAGRAGGLRP